MSSDGFIELRTADELTAQLRQHEIVLVLFGGQQCGVCHSIKPKIATILSEQFPNAQGLYIDCQCESSVELCAQKGVMTLPVVQVYFCGQKFIEKVRSFSLTELEAEMKRIEIKMNQ